MLFAIIFIDILLDSLSMKTSNCKIYLFTKRLTQSILSQIEMCFQLKVEIQSQKLIVKENI